MLVRNALAYVLVAVTHRAATRTSHIRCTLDDPSETEVEAKRASLEKLMQSRKIDDAAGTAGASGFKFEASGGGKRREQPPVVDDIAGGLAEAEDIGRRTAGLLRLGLTFWLNPSFYPFIGGAVFLFAALCALGEFGDTPERFIARAPTVAEGRYYEPRDAGGPLVTNSEAWVLWEPGSPMAADAQ